MLCDLRDSLPHRIFVGLTVYRRGLYRPAKLALLVAEHIVYLGFYVVADPRNEVVIVKILVDQENEKNVVLKCIG